MSSFIFYIVLFLSTKVFILIDINILRKMEGKSFKWKNFRYSDTGYYLLLLSFFLPCLVLFILSPTLEWLLFFIVAGAAGMAGEIVFGLYWDTLFKKRFWIYQIETLFNAYSSRLNYLPWALGGVLCMVIAQTTTYVPSTYELILFWSIFFSGSSIVILVRLLKYLTTKKQRSLEYTKLSWGNYLFVVAPIYLAYIITAFVFGNYLLLVVGIAFAFIGWICEYLFGKVCEEYLSKRLWVYTYKASDNGHITPLAIIPFAIGGFLFLSIFTVIDKIF